MRKRFQQGSVRKSKNGRFWIGVWRRPDHEGERRQTSKVLGRVSKMTKSAAQEELAKIVKPLNEETERLQTVTVKRFVEDVYFKVYERKWKTSTRSTNKDRVKFHIVGDLGARPMIELTRKDLQSFIDSKAKLSRSYVNHLRADLNQMFRLAQAEGVVLRNPAISLFTPKECSVTTKRSLTLAEVKLVFQVLDLRDRLIVKFGILAGMRPGEIFALKCGSLTDISASIRQRVYRGELDTPKTTRSVRDAALASLIREDLEEWLKLSGEGSESWLFPSENKTSPLSKDNVMYRSIRPALRKIGLGWADYQVFRHTHSSLMRDLGVDPKVVADQQGHSLDVNLNVYTETSIQSRLSAVSTLESALVN